MWDNQDVEQLAIIPSKRRWRRPRSQWQEGWGKRRGLDSPCVVVWRECWCRDSWTVSWSRWLSHASSWSSVTPLPSQLSLRHRRIRRKHPISNPSYFYVYNKCTLTARMSSGLTGQSPSRIFTPRTTAPLWTGAPGSLTTPYIRPLHLLALTVYSVIGKSLIKIVYYTKTYISGWSSSCNI